MATEKMLALFTGDLDERSAHIGAHGGGAPSHDRARQRHASSRGLIAVANCRLRR